MKMLTTTPANDAMRTAFCRTPRFGEGATNSAPLAAAAFIGALMR